MPAVTLRQSLNCESCGAQVQGAQEHRTARCPYCASPAVIERPPQLDTPPTFVLGFSITRKRALEIAKRWQRRHWLTAPQRFLRADVARIEGIYLPAYLYTAAAHVGYTVQIGEHYTVTETYSTTDSSGKSVTRTRTKTVTEWRRLQGRWAAFVDDVVVTASRGLPNEELERIEPFDLRELRRYSSKIVSGWAAEDPSMEEARCVELARGETQPQVLERLRQFLPGDTYRSLRFRTRFENEDLESMLLPVWVLAIAYDERRPPVRLIINGQTGASAGAPPYSALKCGLLAVAALVVLLGLLVIWGAQ